LGDGTFYESRITPAPVPNLDNVIAIAVGGHFTLALKSDGTVWGWGQNQNGQLASSDFHDQATPLRIQGLDGVRAIDAGDQHSIALKQDGTMWSWGWDGSGQLGNGAAASRVFPAPVQNLRGVVAIAAGANFSMAITGPAYTISGRISDASGNALAGVAVTANGVSNASVTNSAGYYTLANVLPGKFTLTAARAGVRFVPSAKAITVGAANVTGQNFIGATGYTVTGRIADTAGRALTGVSVARSGTGTPAITNSAGYYSFTDVPSGSVKITPSDSSRIYSPASRTLTIGNADVAAQNFAGTPAYRIIGRITTSSGTALAGVAVARSGAASPVTTNSAGYFVFERVVNGGYTVTPQLNGYTFTPASKNVAVKDADANGQNFVATGQ
jgi:hypothetical protein